MGIFGLEIIKSKVMKISKIIKTAAACVLLSIAFSHHAAAIALTEEDPFSYAMVEEKPEVYINDKACPMQEYMQMMMNQKTPEGCSAGRVMCNLTISSKGEISRVKIVRGLDEATNAAAVKLLETTGKWTPGKQRGNPVAVVITIPVVFR